MPDQNLTPAQLEAVTHDTGPCLVIAGAGTGKTKVITERIAHLILDKKVDPEAIVALTFTDKAAGEMQERLDQLLPYGMFGTTISTFHAFCHDLLKRHSYVVGIDANARLIGKAEEVSLLRSHYTSLGLVHYLPPANPVGFLRDLTSFIDKAKEEQLTPDQLRDHGTSLVQNAQDDADREEGEKIIELAGAYEVATKLYREANVLTYGDLINATLRILQTSAHALKQEQERFTYFLIDEFQDTNTSQATIAYLLAGDRANIFVVGDDDQAIYRFRGANITNILNFRDRYKHAKIVTLVDNFRSGQAILDAAYRLIQHNNLHRLEAQEHLDKRLRAHQPFDNPVNHLYFSHNVYEQEGVTQEIHALIQEHEYAPEDIAILGRSHNHLSGFEQELLACGVPVHRQRDGSFYEQPTIERALCYLRFLGKPHDSYNLFFLLSEIPFSVPLQELREVNVKARRVNNSLWEQLALEDKLAPELEEAKRYLTEQLHDEQNRRPTDALRNHIQRSGWEKILITSEDSNALTQLNTLYFEARNFELLHRPVVLLQYLNHIDDLIASGEDIRVENEIGEEKHGVQLMTIHASKGLEFRAVFVVNLVMDRFPSRGGSRGLPMPEELVTSQEDLVKYEEERRLAYVAFTRARERLYLTHAKRYEQNKRDKKPSVFLQEALGISEEPPLADKPLKASLAPCADEPKATQGFAPPTVYTASALEAFEDSPEKYLEEHVYRLMTEDNAYASFGSCVHEVLHCYFASKKSGEPCDIEAQYAKCWKSEGYENKDQELRWKAEGLEAIKNYIATYPEDFIPDRLEVPVELILENGIKVIGKVDRIDRSPDGSITIIDYKTGRSEAKPAAIKDNLPLAIYAAALSQRKEKVESIQLHYLMTGQQLSLPITTDYTMSTVERVAEIISRIEQAYKTNTFPATKSWGR
jgi:DNA helicase-2/ATP-dependent DNA helicase PcrA